MNPFDKYDPDMYLFETKHLSQVNSLGSSNSLFARVTTITSDTMTTTMDTMTTTMDGPKEIFSII